MPTLEDDYRTARQHLENPNRDTQADQDIKYVLIRLNSAIGNSDFAADLASRMAQELGAIASDDDFHEWAEALGNARDRLSPAGIDLLRDTIVQRIRSRQPNGFCLARMAQAFGKLADTAPLDQIVHVANVTSEYLEKEAGLYVNLLDHLFVLNELSRRLPPDAVDSICRSIIRRATNDNDDRNRSPLLSAVDQLADRCTAVMQSEIEQFRRRMDGIRM